MPIVPNLVAKENKNNHNDININININNNNNNNNKLKRSVYGGERTTYDSAARYNGRGK
jgi:hypothetical protein